MSIKHILSIIKSNNLYEFRKKISDIYWALYNRFLEKYIGRIPTPEAWQGQWFAYNKIKKKYLRASYDIDSIFPQDSIIPDEKNIWIYWNSDIKNAPDIVKKCFTQLQKNKPQKYRIVSLSQDNIKDYVNFPEFILDKLNKGLIAQAHFSDILRTALVYRYGGIWV
ncbi:MAG: capsular polysaccharide synthesis protein, partial [Fibrobacteraceae bacterium]|nr:capsular polysaccharide synthesis protein [Fibrobacteraceae bacterium]